VTAAKQVTAASKTASAATGDWTLFAGTVLLGVTAGLLLVMSPLAIVVLALAAIVVVASGRGLESKERRIFATCLIAGLALRLLVVLALLVATSPSASAQQPGVLFGDEVYSLGRSLRTRNILLGVPASKFDYEVMFDTYADTRYMSWLSWVQLAFGPTSDPIRMLNGVLS
jgi:hypothetical protein